MRDSIEVRCGKCNRLLGKGTTLDFEIKCPRCGAYNHLKASSLNSESQDGQSEKTNDQSIIQ